MSAADRAAILVREARGDPKESVDVSLVKKILTRCQRAKFRFRFLPSRQGIGTRSEESILQDRIAWLP